MILRIEGKIHKQVANVAMKPPMLDHPLRDQNLDFLKEGGFGTNYTRSVQERERIIITESSSKNFSDKKK